MNKYRLYDTVTNEWIDYNSQDEMNKALSMDNPNILSSNGKTSTKRRISEAEYELKYNNSTEGLAEGLLGGKTTPQAASIIYKATGKNPTNTVGDYTHPDGHTSNITETSLGINPYKDDKIFQQNPALRPNSPIYYQNLGKYYGYDEDGKYTDDIPENTIGSSARRALQAQAKNKDEESKSWIAEYYTSKSSGNPMSEEALTAYNNAFATVNASIEKHNPRFDKNNQTVMDIRALSSIAGENALLKYLQNTDPEHESPLWQFQKLSNQSLLQRAVNNENYKQLANQIFDYFISKYYGDIAKSYKDDPISVAQDLEQNGDYAKIKESLINDNGSAAEQLYGLKKGSKGNKIVSTVENAVIGFINAPMNLWTPQIWKSWLGDDKIENAQRDRANAVIDQLASNRVKQERENLEALKQQNPDQFNNYYDLVLNGNGAFKGFDNLASSIYQYYNEHTYGSEDHFLGLTNDEKVDQFIQFSQESQYLGQDLAIKRLQERLQNIDNDKLSSFSASGWYGFRKPAYVVNNLATTTIGTLGNIINFAANINPIGMAKDIYDAAVSDDDFMSALWDEVVDTWSYTLDNDFADWASNLSSTGAWTIKEQERLKSLGIQSTPLLRDYGKENDFWNWNTIGDIIPVTGYMMGSSGGGYLLNGVSKLFKLLGAILKPAVTYINAAEGSIDKVRRMNTLARNLEWAEKTLNFTGTAIDASVPVVTTAGMDMGYAKDNYDTGMEEAVQFVKSEDFQNLIDQSLGMPLDSYIMQNLYTTPNQKFINQVKAYMKENPSLTSLQLAARQMLQQQATKEYMESARDISKLNAALTLGLTIIPDTHIHATKMKMLYSGRTRGAMADIQRSFRKLIGDTPKQETFIKNIKKTEQGWEAKAKDYTYTQLAKGYLNMSYGGFQSNYLQDWGVAAGKGLQQEMLSQYINQRFSPEAAESASYDIDKIILAAASNAGHATFEWQSIRDGLYGALAPMAGNATFSLSSASTEFDSRHVKGENIIKDLAASTWKGFNLNSIAGNLAIEGTRALVRNGHTGPFGILSKIEGNKGIVYSEQQRRQKLITTVQNWLNVNGKDFLDSIGGFIKLSNDEKEAIANNDYTKFTESRLGQMVQAASMFVNLSDTNARMKVIHAELQDRAKRRTFTQEDLDAFQKVSQEVTAAIQKLDPNLSSKERNVEINKIINELVSPEQRAIVSDLRGIEALQNDINSKDSRSTLQKLNDLTENAKSMLSIMENIRTFQSEAEANFGDKADIVVKQEYAKIRAYQQILKKDSQNKGEILAQAQANIGRLSDVTTTINTSDKYVIAATTRYGNNEAKIDEDIADTRQNITNLQNSIDDLLYGNSKQKMVGLRQLKQERKLTNNAQQKDALDRQIAAIQGVVALMQSQLRMMKSKEVELKKIKKALNDNTFLETNQTDGSPQVQTKIISANDIANLPDLEKAALLNSEYLSTAQKAEVDKFLNAVNAVMPVEQGKYQDVLAAKVNNDAQIEATSLIKGLDDQGIDLLNKTVQEARKKQAQIFYAKSFESFADEQNFYRDGETYDADEQNAYERFVERYEQKVQELKLTPNSQEQILGLDKALENNKFYKKYKENEKKVNDIKTDINKYVDRSKFSAPELREIGNLIDYATKRLGITEGNIFEQLSLLPESSLAKIHNYLEKIGETVGSMQDLKNRIIMYNNNISDTIRKNKEEAEKRQQAKTQEKEVQKAKDEAEVSNNEAIINKVLTYINVSEQDSLNSMRQLLTQIGIGNSSSDSYTDQLLIAFRDIIKEAFKKESIKDIQDTLQALVQEKQQDTNNLMDYKTRAYLELAITHLINTLGSQSRDIKAYTLPLPNQENQGQNGARPNLATTNLAERQNRGSEGSYFHFIDLAQTRANKEHILQDIIDDAKVEDFLRNTGLPKGSRIVFIIATAWTNAVKQSMNDAYNGASDMPIIGAVPVVNATETTLEVPEFELNGVKYKYVQPLGVLPSSTKEPNTSKVRTHAIIQSEINGYQVVRDSTDGALISTEIEVRNATTIDTSQDAVPLQLHGTLIREGTFEIEKNPRGHDNLKVKQVPGAQDTNLSTADWGYVTTIDTDTSVNAENKTISEVEDATKFNSRTEGFAKVLTKIGEIISGEKDNVKRNNILNAWSSTNTDVKASSNMNQPISNKDGVALSEFIHLANGLYYSLQPGRDGSIYLSIRDSQNKNNIVITSDNRKLSWKLFDRDSLESGQFSTPIDTILKDLLTARNSQGTIAKWQVHYGNFVNLSNQMNGNSKQVYIKQAINDNILQVTPAATTYDIRVSVIQDSLTKEQIKTKNIQTEEQVVAAALEKHVDPITETVNATDQVGISLEEVFKQESPKSNFWNSAIRDKLHKMLAKLIEAKAFIKSKGEGVKLPVNQHLKRASQTARETNQDIVRFVCGETVDRSVRDFFNPAINTSLEYFVELTKDVFNSTTAENLYNALTALKESFQIQGWKIISNDVYTLDYANNGTRIVGEVDLLAIDAMGNPHIIDIKTYNSDSFVDTGAYARQISMYRDDLQEMMGITIPKENIHIYALKVDNDSRYYKVDRNASTGISTVTKLPAYMSKIQIKKDTRFELFDSTTRNSVSYIGEELTTKYRQARRDRGIGTSQASHLTQAELEGKISETKQRVQNLERMTINNTTYVNLSSLLPDNLKNPTSLSLPDIHDYLGIDRQFENAEIAFRFNLDPNQRVLIEESKFTEDVQNALVESIEKHIKEEAEQLKKKDNVDSEIPLMEEEDSYFIDPFAGARTIDELNNLHCRNTSK